MLRGEVEKRGDSVSQKNGQFKEVNPIDQYIRLSDIMCCLLFENNLSAIRGGANEQNNS